MTPDLPLRRWLDACVKIADRAGAAIMKIYDQGPCAVTMKEGDSPLTEADLAANHIITNALRALTPDIPVVSEEDSGTKEGCDLFWLVDPLDGTREFVQRNGEFTVNIALVERGEPILGVVSAPAVNLTYIGGRGLAALRRNADDLWSSLICAQNGGCTKIVVSRSHNDDRLDEWIADNYPGAERIGVGSSLKFCMLADGRAHVYPRLGTTMEWDTAAGHAVLAAAGGAVKRLDGGSLMYGKSGLKNPDFCAYASKT